MRTPVRNVRPPAIADSLDRNPLRDLDAHVRQVSDDFAGRWETPARLRAACGAHVLSVQVEFALKHFNDVVGNKKLEVLPGNGTVVLETVTLIHSTLKNSLVTEQR